MSIEHHCISIWERQFDNGRAIRIGLLKPAMGGETHCLHIQTPVTNNIHLLNHTDAGWIGLVAYILNGDKDVNPHWIERMLKEQEGNRNE